MGDCQCIEVDLRMERVCPVHPHRSQATTPEAERVLDLSAVLMRRTGGLDIYSAAQVADYSELEVEWGEAVRAYLATIAEVDRG